MKTGNKEDEMEEIVFWKNKNRQKGILDPTLFAEQAEKWASSVSNDSDRGNKKNQPTQLRRFYDEVLRFDSLLKGNEDNDAFEKYLPYIKMLNAKVAYAKGREHVTKRFVDMINICVSQVETKEDFEAFKSFFEAFMGYYKSLNPSKG